MNCLCNLFDCENIWVIIAICLVLFFLCNCGGGCGNNYGGNGCGNWDNNNCGCC